MFYDTSTSRSTPRTNLLTIAFQLWQMLANQMAERRTYAQLSRLDDRMLNDIGLSRGNIRSAIRKGRPDYSI